MAKPNSISPARRSAFEILSRVEDGAFASVLLATQDSELNSNDLALRHELVLGVLRWRLFLDTLIQHFAERKGSSLDLPVLISLRLGLYQLRFLSRIPPSAAVNESVNLVRMARLRSAEGFVNAVLRRATRELDYDPLVSIDDPVERLAVETSHPPWLVKRWSDAFGLDFAAEFARANNQSPPLAFRIVRNRAGEDQVIRVLEKSGAKVTRSRISSGWRLEGASSGLLELARSGQTYVQDEASQLVAEVVSAEAGERILDLCAAPGSKTSHMADLSDDRAVIVAGDVNEARLKTVIQTASLHKLTGITPVLVDGLRQLPFIERAFDALLVDAPCSGTGTLRRNPEIRWRITTQDFLDLSTRQRQLLTNAGQAVRPGGRLVYSTCSVEREENEEVVSDFIARNNDFERIDCPVSPILITTSKAVRTWPQRDGADGFFISALRRKLD